MTHFVIAFLLFAVFFAFFGQHKVVRRDRGVDKRWPASPRRRRWPG